MEEAHVESWLSDTDATTVHVIMASLFYCVLVYSQKAEQHALTEKPVSRNLFTF